MATHVLQLLKMVQLKYGVTMICKFFFWSFHMIYIVYLLSVIWTFFLWSQGVILLISTNWFWYWKLWISPAHYEIIFCQNIILLNVNYTSLICAFLLLLWWKESLNNSAVIGESHAPCTICAFAIEMAHYIDCLTHRQAHCFLIASLSLTPTDVFSNHGALPKVFHSELFH
jgi:hypothetical protein